MLNLPNFPQVIDSTIRAAIASCDQKFYWEFIRHYRKAGGNIHLIFGGAFAEAMKVARQKYYGIGLSIDESICEAMIAATNYWLDAEGDNYVLHKGNNAHKSYLGLIDAIASYHEHWPMDIDPIQPYRLADGQPFVEKTFAFPIPGTRHPITNEPIIYCGRLDMLGVWKDSDLKIVVDEKTSTSLGDSWAVQWHMRGQITGYCKGSDLFGIPVRNAMIRGVAVLKADVTFNEQPEVRKQWQIDEWLVTIRNDINRAITNWQRMKNDWDYLGDGMDLHNVEYWSKNFDQSCSSYGGCSYMDLCTSNNPERWLARYETVNWNPLEER